MPDPSPTSNPDSLVRTVQCKTPEEFLDVLSRRGYGFRGPLKTQRFLEICELDEFFKTADSIGLALPEDTQTVA